MFGHRFVASPSGRERNVSSSSSASTPSLNWAAFNAAYPCRDIRSGARIRRRHPIDKRLDIASVSVPFLVTRKKNERRSAVILLIKLLPNALA